MSNKGIEYLIFKSSMEMGSEDIAQSLLKNDKFLESLRKLLLEPKTDCNKEQGGMNLNDLISQVERILNRLIEKKMANEMNYLIDDNNRILLEIKSNLEKQYSKPQSLANIDSSFGDVRRLIDEEKKKMEEFNDADMEESISNLVDVKFENIDDKLCHLDKRVKMMEDKYETNLKSIWNVLSITESAIFEHIKQCRETSKGKLLSDKDEKSKKENRNSGMFKFWS